jgi:hypothetical protein
MPFLVLELLDGDGARHRLSQEVRRLLVFFYNGLGPGFGWQPKLAELRTPLLFKLLVPIDLSELSDTHFRVLLLFVRNR